MPTIRLTKIPDLTPADWSIWLDLQERTGVYESPYFRPEFSQAVAQVRDDAEVAVIKEGEQTVGFFPFQRGKLNLGKPIGGKLSDYHGPLIRQGVEFDAAELLPACRLAAWDFDHLVSATNAFAPYITTRDKSPIVDLGDGFEAHMRRRKEAGSDTIHRQGQKARKLAREVGLLEFTFDEADGAEAFELLTKWKSAQYLRTGLMDVLAFPWTVALLERLRQFKGEQFSAPLSVLRAGNTIAAITLSMRSRGVLHSWFTAYNPELASYSPGLTLFIQLAQEGLGLGIRKIDLGRGEERYKWSLTSTGVDVAEGSITSPSLATWLRSRWRGARKWVQTSRFKDVAKVPAKLIQPVRSWLAYH